MELNESAALQQVEPLIRVRMLVAYDGSQFHGFAYQGTDLQTVAKVLKESLCRLLGNEPELAVAGRTDTGVHAWGQVVSFDMPSRVKDRFTFDRMQRSLNRQLAPNVVVREISEVSTEFHARYSALVRRYRYSVYNSPTPSPFHARTSWWVADVLDMDAMNLASSAIVGEHDFSSFCRRPTPDSHLRRRIISAEWLRLEDNAVRFDVAANAFCHQMVRSLTGMLIEIGRGRRSVESMGEVLRSGDRQLAAPLAPPQGLCLWQVDF